MGYPLDLDEHEEHQLIKELARRAEARDGGLCDYCERSEDASVCKFPERHRASQNSPVCRCDDCSKVWHENQVVPMYRVRDLQERLDPGGEVPVGECPACGALCYIDKEAT
jgi:hypothetical protein